MFDLFNNDLGLTQKQVVLKMLQTKECTPRDFMLKWIARYWEHIFRLRKEWKNIKMKEEITRDSKWQKIVSRHTFYSLTF